MFLIFLVGRSYWAALGGAPGNVARVAFALSVVFSQQTNDAVQLLRRDH